MGRYLIKIMVFAVLLIACFPNCAGKKDVLSLEPGKTSGKIYVGNPRVVARERLVNDRFKQEEWLKYELDKAKDATFGFQGMMTRQSLYSRLLAANILGDARLADRFATELKLASFLQGEKAATTANETVEADLVTRLSKLFTDAADALKPPTSITAENTKVSASPIDLFRDKLAYREEIRAEYLDNSLDDRHDLSGNNLYRMVFDTTIFPQNDTSAWAWIEVSVLDSSCEFNWNELYHEWLRRFEEDLKVAAVRYMAFVKTKKKKNKDKEMEIDYREGFSYLPEAILDDAAIVIQNEASSFGTKVGQSGINENAKILSRIAGIEKTILSQETKKEMVDNIFAETRIILNTKDDAKAAQYLISRVLIYRNFEKYDLARYANVAMSESDSGYTIWVKAKPNGMQNFRQKLTEQRDNIFAYSVTPKETVERLADSSRMSQNMESLLAIQFILGDVAGETIARFIKERHAVYTAIKRQPLIVGFSSIDDHNGLTPPTWDLPNSCTAASGPVHCRFGWIIGPRFGTTPNAEKGVFRHRNVQNAVAALVALPPWWKYATLRVSTKWVKEDGTIMDGPWDQNDKIIKVRLPGYISDATSALVADLRRDPLPLGCSIKDDQYLQAGKDVDILIIGEELWRSPEVTLGGQKADSIRVLPSMKGIIARFDDLKVTAAPLPKVGAANTATQPVMMDLRVWNGDGHSFVKEVEVLPPPTPGKGENTQRGEKSTQAANAASSTTTKTTTTKTTTTVTTSSTPTTTGSTTATTDKKDEQPPPKPTPQGVSNSGNSGTPPPQPE